MGSIVDYIIRSKSDVSCGEAGRSTKSHFSSE